MMIETFEQALQLANEFLATKERKNYYESKSILNMQVCSSSFPTTW